MARRVSVHRVCDRCGSPFDESQHKYGEELPKFPYRRLSASIYEDADGDDKGSTTKLFEFNDLCPDCDRVVEGFIKKIRMDSDEEPKKPKKSKGDKSPQVEESQPEAALPVAEPVAQITELPGTTDGLEPEQKDPHPF